MNTIQNDTLSHRPSDGFNIKTPRLLLRPPQVSDVQNIWPLVSDSRLTTFLAWDAHRSLEETSRMIVALNDVQQMKSGFHWLALHENIVVGLVSLIDVRWSHRCWILNRAELAYWIGVPFQGMGYATEAAGAVMEFGFKQLDLHKIRVYHAADNLVSGKAIKKLGFRPVGIEQDAFQKNGIWHHLSHFELLSSEWLNNNQNL